ncbi:HepT-like ribonuclease domain-containing protein [Psychrilyobacter atlanticus]|uniref:HepT-like ribonuclease domain-containing protein n=1 Tax=Psychrilyobacter atlanticus TaxID=271091 RepID=UPI0003FB47DE|nr:HepT-like ribonuclease domain-containing protein [Psychrilyobacter atlanticus]
MLENTANDLLYILSILESVGKIEKYSELYDDAEHFFDAQDQMPFNATLSLLINIGEVSGKITENIKEKYSEIPWKLMKDFRNRVAHDYMNLDIFITFNIIKKELPRVKSDIEELLINELNNEKFIMEEYKVCIGNRYYKHINFEKINNELKSENKKTDKK